MVMPSSMAETSVAVGSTIVKVLFEILSHPAMVQTCIFEFITDESSCFFYTWCKYLSSLHVVCSKGTFDAADCRFVDFRRVLAPGKLKEIYQEKAVAIKDAYIGLGFINSSSP